jgi:PKD repeat protein
MRTTAIGVFLLLLVTVFILPAVAVVQPVEGGNELTVSGIILPGGALVATFSAKPLTGAAPLTVQFTDMSTGAIESRSWAYRKGSGRWKLFSSERNPSYTLKDPGTYDIRLIVTGPGGKDEEIKINYIKVNQPERPPVAGFSGKPSSGTAPLKVSFTDRSTGVITAYAWDFDNNGIIDSTEKNPSYTYTMPGTYTVNLKVTGPGGSDTEIKTKYITVKSSVLPPVALFSQDKYYGRSPLTVHFTDHSRNNPTSYFWRFGDGSSSTERNPTHQFTRPGFYVIQERVTNAAGSDTAFSAVAVTRNGWWWLR